MTKERKGEPTVEYFKEPHRPLFHYSAESHIINDPNGLVYYDGEYHLFHQYNVHNHIHWGHAVSRDLVHWRHLPPALFPDSIGQIWSGSAVVDARSTSGLQTGKENVLVALFTYNEHVDAQQSQGLAYSNDRGRSWQMYCGNPVLTGKGQKDFRDPKVFWHGETGRWVMVLACGDHAEFYASRNLLQWEYTGEFGRGAGAPIGTWECPDLFQLPLEENAGENRWVLVVSVNDGAPAGGTGMQYFIGGFDGFTFHNENPAETVLWLDYGKDFYAGVTWNNIPEKDGRRLIIAWADNWLYRDDLPTCPFRGQLSSVRELQLKETAEGVRLRQQPAGEIENLRRKTITLPASRLVEDEYVTCDAVPALELRCCFSSENPMGCAEIRLLSREDIIACVGYDFATNLLYLERPGGNHIPNGAFSGRFTAPLRLEKNIVRLRLLVDVSQIEVFAQEGAVSMTALMFPSRPPDNILFAAKGGACHLSQGTVHLLESVWQDTPGHQKTDLFPLVGNWAITLDGMEGDCETEGLLLAWKVYGAFSLEADIQLTNYRQGARAGFAIGLSDAEPGFRLVLDAQCKCLSLERGEQIIASVAQAINRQRRYQLKAQCENDRISVLLDGVELLSHPLPAYHPGRIGLFVDGTLARFEEIKWKEEGVCQ